MPKLVKFPLAFADGTKARTIEELREHADIASIAQHFENGKLQRWLAANYLDDLSEKADATRKGFRENSAKVKAESRCTLRKSGNSEGWRSERAGRFVVTLCNKPVRKLYFQRKLRFRTGYLEIEHGFARTVVSFFDCIKKN